MSASVFQSSSFSQMSRLLRASSSARRRPVAVDPQARSRATRCLFGPVDHEATRRFLATELTEISLRDQLRWGFNFQLEKPVESNTNTKQRYVWDRVPVGDQQVSEAYRLPSMDTAHDETPIATETAAPTTKSPASLRKTKSRTRRLVVAAAAASTTSNLRQLKITDFTKVQRKRSFDEILEEKSSKMISSSSSSRLSRLEPPIKQARAS